MIRSDITPIGHIPPYKRIDPNHPGRRAVITTPELAQSGGREPDAAIYRYSHLTGSWHLKDGI